MTLLEGYVIGVNFEVSKRHAKPRVSLSASGSKSIAQLLFECQVFKELSLSNSKKTKNYLTFVIRDALVMGASFIAIEK